MSDHDYQKRIESAQRQAARGVTVTGKALQTLLAIALDRVARGDRLSGMGELAGLVSEFEARAGAYCALYDLTNGDIHE